MLHGVNLVFHEAGHLLWAWGGEVLLGGVLLAPWQDFQGEAPAGEP